MKRRYLVFLAAASLALNLFTGCSNKEAGDDINIDNIEDKLADMSDEDIADAISDAVDKLDSADGDKTESDISGENAGYKLFPAVEEWKDVDMCKMNVQIDDLLYTPGMSADDFIKQVESSSIKYEYEYNPDKLVPARSFEKILISRDGKEWFVACAFNPTSELASLSSQPVVSIAPRFEAHPYCRFIDGRSYAEISSLTYSDVKALSDIFEEYGYTYTEEKGIGVNIMDLDYTISRFDSPSLCDWTGYAIRTGAGYHFSLNTDTSEIRYMFSSVFAVDYKPHQTPGREHRQNSC